jgi:hypothetical protein
VNRLRGTECNVVFIPMRFAYVRKAPFYRELKVCQETISCAPELPEAIRFFYWMSNSPVGWALNTKACNVGPRIGKCRVIDLCRDLSVFRV